MVVIEDGQLSELFSRVGGAYCLSASMLEKKRELWCKMVLIKTDF